MNKIKKNCLHEEFLTKTKQQCRADTSYEEINWQRHEVVFVSHVINKYSLRPCFIFR